MRAIVVGALEGPDVLQVREVDRPSADSGETLIQVDRAGVNFADIGRRRDGWSKPSQPLPVIPGFEVVRRRVSDGARQPDAGANNAVRELGGVFGVALSPRSSRPTGRMPRRRA